MAENKVFVGDFIFSSKYESDDIKNHLGLMIIGGLILINSIEESISETSYVITQKGFDYLDSTYNA